MWLLLVWVAIPLTLPLVLAALHLVLWRFAHQPMPLFQRERPVSGWSRLATGLLGVAVCYLLCAVVAFIGLRTVPGESSLVLDPLPGMPAARAGVRSGDIARGIDGHRISRFEEIGEGVRRGGDTVELELEREGRPLRLVVDKGPQGRIGVASRRTLAPAGLAAGRALMLPARYAAAMLEGIAAAIVGSNRHDLEGPVGVARTVASGRDSLLPGVLVLMCYQLPKIALAYLLVMVLDGLARRRYQASLA